MSYNITLSRCTITGTSNIEIDNENFNGSPCVIRENMENGSKDIFVVNDISISYRSSIVTVKLLRYSYDSINNTWYASSTTEINNNEMKVTNRIAVNPTTGVPLDPQPENLDGQVTEFQFWQQHLGLIIESATSNAIIRRSNW